MHQRFTQMYSTVSKGSSGIDEEILRSLPPSNRVSPHFTIEPFPFVASPFFPQPNPPNTFQKINKISKGYEKPPHTLFFGFNKIHSFGQSVRAKSPLAKFTGHHM